MTCYLKKLKPVLEKAGFELLNKDQKKIVDKTVRDLTGAKGRCPQVWPVVKEWLQDSTNEELLIREVKNKLVEP